MPELTGERKKMTGAQRLSLGIGHAIGKYRLGTARRPEDVKMDLVLILDTYMRDVINDFDSDAFMRAAGYRNR